RPAGRPTRRRGSMAHFMLRLDAALRRRRWLVLGAWVVALAVALPFAARQSDHLTGGGYGVRGSQSQATADAIARGFPHRAGSSLAVVVHDRAQLAATAAAARAVPRLALAPGSRAAALAPLRAGRPALVPLAVSAADDK